MSDYQPIACIDHERLEFAVLRRQPLTLTLRDGRILTGVPCDIYAKQGEEWLVWCDRHDGDMPIRLDLITDIRVGQSG